MTTSIIRSSFSAGEISPSLWGRTDLAKYHIGCATLRNMVVGIRGNAFSRAGTRFVGQCRQPASASSVPPRDITFRFNINQNYVLEFGDFYMRIKVAGGYVLEAAKAITGATQANPCVLTVPAHGYANGDWVFLQGVLGMTQLNAATYIVANVTTNTFSLTDPFGNPINSLAFGAYVSGGTVARLVTVSTIYAAVDLPYLKFTQSADVMTLTLSSPVTGNEYPQQNLTRNSATSWTFAPVSFASSIAAPGGCTATPTTRINALASPNNVPAAQYSYVVTAVDALTGNESVASPVGSTPSDNSTGSVDMSITAGAVTVQWTAVTGAGFYNVYRAPAAVWNTGVADANPPATVPTGSSFGFIGSSFGTQFVDSNIIADFTKTPPLHLNPFARGQVLKLTKTGSGAGYAQATTSAAMSSATGSAAVLLPVVVGGDVVAVIIQNPGQNFQPGDGVVISGAGSGATFSATIGPQSGTYPGVVGFFQQRIVYADSFNNPDTEWMSQPGSFNVFDSASPPIDSDAITTTPWAQQVNGVQWLVPMPGGLITLTGLDAWQISGTAGAGSPVTPSSINAQSQESYGTSGVIPPIKVNYHLLYAPALGSAVRDLTYNFFTNTFAGDDLTQYSNHLFDGHSLLQWAWAREPNKVIWAVRDDNIMLSLTYLKEQEILGWGRRDTNGLYVSVVTASEPPVDAVYTIAKRFVPGKGWAYYSERDDNRFWLNAEATWCVDCGLALSLPQPSATLSAASATGQNVPFVASAAVFDGVNTGAVGQIIRMGGGRAQVTTYVSPTQVLTKILLPITATMPNDPTNMPIPAGPGTWSIATPVTTISGLPHLEGYTVAILADANVLPRQVVTNGTITLSSPATQVLIGLPFQPQLQTLNQDVPGGPTIQGKRKKTNAVTLRVEKSRGMKVGTNQPNASQQENYANVPWGQGTQLVGKMVPVRQPFNQLGPANYLPLFTGDLRELVDGDWDLTGMVAFQQDDPLPMSILASIPEVSVGDSDG
jgi:hypothetical protein